MSAYGEVDRRWFRRVLGEEPEEHEFVALNKQPVNRQNPFQIDRSQNVANPVSAHEHTSVRPKLKRGNEFQKTRGVTRKRANYGADPVELRRATARLYPKTSSSVRIGPLKSGTLGNHGYKSSLSAAQRHAALRKAIKAHGKDTVIRKLNAVAVLNKNRSPTLSATFRADQQWVSGTKGGTNHGAAIGEIRKATKRLYGAKKRVSTHPNYGADVNEIKKAEKSLFGANAHGRPPVAKKRTTKAVAEAAFDARYAKVGQRKARYT